SGIGIPPVPGPAPELLLVLDPPFPPLPGSCSPCAQAASTTLNKPPSSTAPPTLLVPIRDASVLREQWSIRTRKMDFRSGPAQKVKGLPAFSQTRNRRASTVRPFPRHPSSLVAALALLSSCSRGAPPTPQAMGETSQPADAPAPIAAPRQEEP